MKIELLSRGGGAPSTTRRFDSRQFPFRFPVSAGIVVFALLGLLVACAVYFQQREGAGQHLQNYERPFRDPELETSTLNVRDREKLQQWIAQTPDLVTAPEKTLIILKPQVDELEQPGDEYIKNCRANDVPIPPDWPDDRWIARGDLHTVFAAFPDAKSNEVFTYEDPDRKGVCYAFVRKNHNKYFEALGIICQSRKTGKACFWDNVVPGERHDTRIRGLEIKLDIRKIGNGSNMRERCTDCHRGAKVFLIHPGTPLDAIKARQPEVRYSPMGQADWENPPPLEKVGESACTQCHELPALSKRYCGLLRQAAEKTMPSTSRPAGWDNPRAEFKEVIERLKARCAALD